MATAERNAPVEFSRIVEAERITAGELRLDLAASPAECRQLARRFGLQALEALRATAVLSRVDDAGTVRLRLHWQADIVQDCVVTLEPIATHLDSSSELIYAPDNGALARATEREIIVGIDSDDPPEPLIDGKIDVGEVVAEQLALNVEAYPRKPGAELSAVWSGPALADAPAGGAFAALRRLADRS